MAAKANSQFAQKMYEDQIGIPAPPAEEAPKKGRTGSKAPATPVANPYESQVKEWSNQKNNATKPTYTDTYADRIAEMEKTGSPAYTSKFQSQIDSLLDQIAGRGSFQYDMQRDPLYQQYRQQYMQSGQQAMRDTLGQAAGLTGGYGSSYATTAGNQAYQQHLNALNSRALDLQGNALNVYQAEGDRLQNVLGNYQTEEGSHYGRYQDAVADAYNRLTQLRAGQAFDYGRYRDELGQYNTEYQRALDQYKYWYEHFLKG